MALITTKVEPIDRDIQLIINQELSPEAQAQALADFAIEAIKEGDETNRLVLGRIPPRKLFVDGSETGAIGVVRPTSIIVAEWELVADVLLFIADELKKVSPVRSGRYQASHTLFADGVEINVGREIPQASEYVFLSDVPYAIKIEGAGSKKAESPQAPRGVYQITALKANGRYGNTAKVRFEWRKPYRGGLVGGREGNKSSGRVPAIVVTIRS